MLINLLEILIFGSLILLSFLLITNPLKVNKRANIWLGICMLIWSSFWMDEIVLLTTGADIELSSMLVPNFIQFLTPLVFFFSIRFFTNPDYTFRKRGLVYLVMPAIYLALIILNRSIAADLKIFWVSLLLIHGLLYVVLSLILLRKHKTHIRQFASNTSEIDLTWLEYIIGALALMIISISIFNFVFYEAPLNSFMNGLVYMVILFMAYHSLKQKEIFPKDEQERAELISIAGAEGLDSNRGKILSDEKLVDIKAMLHDLMLKNEPYLDCDLNLSNLAKQLNITPHQLSYVINSGFNENFYGYINKFRVEKSKRLLMDDKANKFSMLGIAFESGFNSKTSFNTTFKKITGKTPSEFKKRSADL